MCTPYCYGALRASRVAGMKLREEDEEAEKEVGELKGLRLSKFSP